MADVIWITLPIIVVVILVLRHYFWPLQKHQQKKFTQDYFEGLNYLLNEQTDKAIEVFTRMLEVEKETVEIYLALGNLFRRRGEVERSIRIHQNLIAKTELSNDQRDKALLELANDYLRAGLLDRAEALLLDLVKENTYSGVALKCLADIYEQEKDWAKAIEVMRKLDKTTAANTHNIIAQYYCELAVLSAGAGDTRKTIEWLHEALRICTDCVRASLMLSRVLLDQGEIDSAIARLKRVGEQNPEYLGEVIEPLHRAYTALGNTDGLLVYLRRNLPIQGNASISIMIADLIREKSDDKEATVFMLQQLNQNPSIRGLDWLLKMNLEHSTGKDQQYYASLRQLTMKMLENSARYKCGHCGFSGRILHWQCLGCKTWNSVKPAQPECLSVG